MFTNLPLSKNNIHIFFQIFKYLIFDVKKQSYFRIKVRFKMLNISFCKITKYKQYLNLKLVCCWAEREMGVFHLGTTDYTFNNNNNNKIDNNNNKKHKT